MSVALEQPVSTIPASAGPLKRQAVRGGAVVLATRLLIQIVTWSLNLLVARWLEPFDYGIMTIGTIFVGLADLLAEGGLGKALIQKPTLGRDDLAQAFTINVLLAAALYGLLFVLAGPAAAYLEMGEFTTFLRWLALVLLLIPFKAVPLALLERNLRLGRQSAIYLAASLVQAGLVVGLARAGLGYWALLTGVVAARVLEAATLTWLAGWRPALAWPRAAAWSLLGFGLPATGASLLWFIYSNSDFAVVEALLGAAVLGAYALAFQLMSLPAQKLTANINQVAFPVFCRLAHDRARLKNWFLRLTVLLGFLGWPALGGMILVAPDAFRLLFGDAWTGAVLPFQVLGGAGMVMLVAAAFPPLFNALGRPGINVQYTAACTLILPVCFLAGGYMAGIVGICLAWLIVYPAIVAVFIASTRAITGVGLVDVLEALAPVVIGVAAMTAAVLAVQSACANDEPGFRLTLTIAAGAAAYVAAMLAFARATVMADMRAMWQALRG